MMERFGISEGSDGKLTINTNQCAYEVGEKLADYFKFQGHFALIQFTAPGYEAQTLRKILNLRNEDPSSSKEINELIERLNAAQELGGVTTYTGDLNLGLVPPPEYMIFISNALAIRSFPIILGEEITHGEHNANTIRRDNLTLVQYQNRFQTLTKEFLGYLGRQVIISAAGLKGNYSTELPLDRNLTYNDWSHLIAYWALDDLIEKGKELPAVDLFHAKSENRFWKILMEAVKEPVTLNIAFPQDLSYEKLAGPVLQIVSRAKAQKAIQISFSYIDEGE